MPTLKQVAFNSQVSIATVSRVINNDSKVSPKTKLKVLKAIEELNYKPNRVAQRLRNSKGKIRLIALLIPDIQNPFYLDVINGVEEYAYKNNFVVMIGNFNQNPEKEKLYLDIYRSENVDGFIVAPVHGRDKNVEDLVLEGFPVVCIDRGLTMVDVDVVNVENKSGAFQATEHLLKLGHRKIAFISGDLKIPTYEDRLKGYKQALHQYNLNIHDDLILVGNSTYKSGLELTNIILEMDKKPSAIFTTNNLLTLGSLEALNKREVQVPDDVSIVGFDDMYWSPSLNPPLTAVRQPGFEIGKRAADLLYQRILNPDSPKVNLILKTELIVRKSSAPIGRHTDFHPKNSAEDII